MTLNSDYALYYIKHYITCLSFGAHHKNLNADRLILSAAEMKRSPLNVVCSDIRVMQIFAGVREICGVKQESGRLRCHNAIAHLPYG